jgi:hypothetical protein
VRWLLDGRPVASQYVTDRRARAIITPDSPGPGVYQLVAELYPWGPDEGVVAQGQTQSVASTDLVVRESIVADPDDGIVATPHLLIDFNGWTRVWTDLPDAVRVTTDGVLDVRNGAMGYHLVADQTVAVEIDAQSPAATSPVLSLAVVPHQTEGETVSLLTIQRNETDRVVLSGYEDGSLSLASIVDDVSAESIRTLAGLWQRGQRFVGHLVETIEAGETQLWFVMQNTETLRVIAGPLTVSARAGAQTAVLGGNGALLVDEFALSDHSMELLRVVHTEVVRLQLADLMRGARTVQTTNVHDIDTELLLSAASDEDMLIALPATGATAIVRGIPGTTETTIIRSDDAVTITGDESTTITIPGDSLASFVRLERVTDAPPGIRQAADGTIVVAVPAGQLVVTAHVHTNGTVPLIAATMRRTP